jgi:hypothetical protein
MKNFIKKTTSRSDFFVGQEVKLNTHSAQKGMGYAHFGDIGTVVELHENGVNIDFPSQQQWMGAFDEFLIQVQETEIEFAICKKAFPGGSVGQRFVYASYASDFFSDEYFDFECKTTTPKLKLFDFDVEFIKGGASWGCKSFTTKELQHILKAVEIIQSKDLKFRLGFHGVSSQVTQDELSSVIQYCK